MMIAVWSAKGGTGVSSMAWGMARAMNETVYLMDFDVLTPTLAAMAGLDDTHHGLDRVLLHTAPSSIQHALDQNWVRINKVSLLPGVKYLPGQMDRQKAEPVVQALLEPLHSGTVIVDVGTGIFHPLQREMLLRADAILVVVTPDLMSYHRLWTMWQNDFFLPYGQVRKTGVLINRFHGFVSPKDIATLMDLWLAGDVPTVKQMEDAINQGQLDAAFPKPFLKCLRKMTEDVAERAEKTNSLVKASQTRSTQPSGDRREWPYATQFGSDG